MVELREFETDLEWQINRRALIQELLFRQYDFLRKHTEFPDDGDDEWYPMLRMVHIAFSLWRSAFLTDVNLSRRTIYNHTKDFIEKVLKQNSITFADDHRLNELTVSYYNNNARYRLERMCLHDEKLSDLESMAIVQMWKTEPGLDFENQRKVWDTYYKALVECFDIFESNWNTKVRPRRQRR